MGRFWLFMCFVLATSCSSSVIASAPTASAPASQPYRDEYEWYRRSTIQAYENIGHRNPSWDSTARGMLEAYAQTNAATFGPQTDMYDVFERGAALLRKTRCDDPFLLYLAERNLVQWHKPAADILDIAMSAVDRMKKSSYHPYYKCYAFLRGAEAKAAARENVADELQAARGLMDQAIEQIPAILDDADVPRTALWDLMLDVGEASVAVTNNRETYAARAGKILDEKCKDRSLVLAITARFYTSFAWDARGNGFADTITKEGGQLMDDRLEIAAAAGDKAYELDPKNVCGPLVMLSVELGQGQGEKRMETWFSRAIDADPNNYHACDQKLKYLEPKWYGSVDKMVAFGRELLKQGNFTAGLPIILVDAHLAGARYTDGGYMSKPQPAYFQNNPQAWDDVRAVYDPYLKQFPNSLYHRSRYAQIAVWAQKWDEADKQFKAMGDRICFMYFRTATNYHRVRAEVESHIRPVQ